MGARLFLLADRAVVLRCPHWGIGQVFRSFFRSYPHCSQCGFIFLRESAYFGSRSELFFRLVQQAVAIEPTPYKAMVKCSAAGVEHNG